ncbi:hypothetical protein CNMCM6106_009076 [Aspergillus hiratsukae]|uniref:Helitron helicase-like domain-containing protein n=1 Tax=Aspergillus hiratsukae TaxID=1194566 RepID=A0A8H6QJ33_9EURO|nr:hypothetical protein CNMCM6106_009076 [Aspergillus hiratsukae]
MTTNPQWSEIQSQLLPGQDVTDVPAVVCRAFRARLGVLKAFLRKRFGGLVYEISVVEFQKRGLPDAHIVVKFKQEPPLSALDIFISAELPDADQEPDLYHQGRAVTAMADVSMATRSPSTPTRTWMTWVACTTGALTLRAAG